VLITFVAGLLVAMALNSPDLRALRFYRVLIVLPFAMPSFAMLLVWRDMFNQDFGLINGITGQSINWFGQVWTARFAILLIQFWLGYPYMFLVCLGALQAIPKDLTEAAAVDGASATRRSGRWSSRCCSSRWRAAHLVVRLQLQQLQHHRPDHERAPFPPDNPRPAHDILVSLVYKLAFAAGGAQYGFAAPSRSSSS
jgi:arabinogalactan oligomer/maltooligosaccharide transport system permease protein